MDLLFESTKRFEKDLKSLPNRDRQLVIGAINKYGSEVCKDPAGSYRKVSWPHLLKLKSDLDPSLYVLKISRDIRVILTLDEDPIFNQIIVGLKRVVRHGEMKKAFIGIAESLYQGMLNNQQCEEDSNG